MEPAAEVSESLSSVKTADLWECVFVFGETTYCEERKWGISSFKILLCHGTVASLPSSKINLYYPKKKVGDGWTKDWLLVSKLPRAPPLERLSFPSPPLPHPCDTSPSRLFSFLVIRLFNKFWSLPQCVTRPKIWTIPIPRLFSVPNFFETDSETFFGT